jgi:farnesyl-diphosphate farnesyltransferase
VLPGALGQAVLDAYLLCRIADTVEDAPDMQPERKAELFDDFLAAFDSPDARQRFVDGVKPLRGEQAHLALTHNSDLVLAHFATLPPRTQAVVRKWVTEMVVGMRKFVLLYPNGIRIQTVEEYKEYCYYVAGTVGYMLTDLWHEHSPSISERRYAILRERCRAFAEALQTVNILKDVATDAEKENSIYVPEELLRAQGSTHSRILSPELIASNREALTQLIPACVARSRGSALPICWPHSRRAVSIRLFCILPLLLAYATLRDPRAEHRDAQAWRIGEDLTARGEVTAHDRRDARNEQQRSALAGRARPSPSVRAGIRLKEAPLRDQRNAISDQESPFRSPIAFRC